MLLLLGYIKWFIKYMVELLGKRVPKERSIKLVLNCDTLSGSFNKKASSLILISTFFFPFTVYTFQSLYFFFFSVTGFNPVIHVTQECFSPCLHPTGGFSTTTKDVPVRILLAVLPETTLVPAEMALCFMFQVANPPEEIILFNKGGEALHLCNLR